jgi:hypothetical protein
MQLVDIAKEWEGPQIYARFNCTLINGVDSFPKIKRKKIKELALDEKLV